MCWSRSGLRTLPLNAKMHYNFANLQKDSGSWQSAVGHYRRAIEYNNHLYCSFVFIDWLGLWRADYGRRIRARTTIWARCCWSKLSSTRPSPIKSWRSARPNSTSSRPSSGTPITSTPATTWPSSACKQCVATLPSLHWHLITIQFEFFFSNHLLLFFFLF